MSQRPCIRVIGARQHNLRNVSVEIPRGVLTVITGVSGSGKSSLAFDTLFAEGQRRYVESLSVHARQFLEQLPRPDVDRIEGLPPTIAIEQRGFGPGPRSTVATSTEILDFLRVYFARLGVPRCWHCDRVIERQSTAQVVDAVVAGPEGQRILVLAPLLRGQRGQHAELLERVRREGFVRVRVDGQISAIEELPALAASRKHDIDVVVDRLVVKPEIVTRLAESVETAARLSGGRIIISAESKPGDWRDRVFSQTLSCPEHADARIDELSPALFSFNAPHGACESCHGLGTRLEFDPELVVPDPSLSLRAGAVAAWRHQGRQQNAAAAEKIQAFCETFGVLPDAPFRNLPADRRRILLHGTTDEDRQRFGADFEGVLPDLLARWNSTASESAKQRLHAFLAETPCEACGGARYNRRALCVRVAGRSIADLHAMTIAEAATFLDQLDVPADQAPVAEPLRREMRHRLRFLADVGVEYLALNRSSESLSGGEFQRIRLATQIGSGLAGVCYVLDEPTVGLHARDTQRLTDLLHRLAEMDNTVVVVEHDEAMIAGADWMIDIGPGAGLHGGRLIAAGTVEEVRRCEASITARFLTGASCIALPDERRPIDEARCLELAHVTAHNLKGIDVRFPLGRLVCVSGVSGSGKSTLVNDVLLRALKRRLEQGGAKPGPFGELRGAEHVDRVINIDQAPIGRTPRSNPATYVGVFNLIRALFARTREAKVRGYAASRFSFNIRGGRCEHCEGQGVRRVRMHFLPDVFLPCGECGATRYNRETLEVRYRGKNIADVLAMPVEEAVTFFDNFHNIRQRLQALKDVGLGYMTLGQASSTLSGGEAQRVKLAAELHRTTEGHTVYILDEPTTGLHPADVRNLLTLLQRLVDRGQTVLVIEHHLDVIKVADWVIDLGPEGGADGGRVVVVGTPEAVAACPDSHTGRFLKHRLVGD